MNDVEDKLSSVFEKSNKRKDDRHLDRVMTGSTLEVLMYLRAGTYSS